MFKSNVLSPSEVTSHSDSNPKSCDSPLFKTHCSHVISIWLRSDHIISLHMASGCCVLHTFLHLRYRERFLLQLRHSQVGMSGGGGRCTSCKRHLVCHSKHLVLHRALISFPSLSLVGFHPTSSLSPSHSISFVNGSSAPACICMGGSQ